jgi:hypothetical protein
MPDPRHTTYYRARWPEQMVPPGEPTWFHYEVDTQEDVVSRSVDLFDDGRKERNSIEVEERDGSSCPSLVDGSFVELTRSVALQEISRADFEALWLRGEDTPFWNPRRAPPAP